MHFVLNYLVSFVQNNEYKIIELLFHKVSQSIIIIQHVASY